MSRLFIVLLVVCSSFAVAFAESLQPADAEALKDKPPVGERGALADLLNGWYEAGKAAGNIGDVYDNRDGDHSSLRMNQFPQVRKIIYSTEEKKRRRHWALMREVWPHIVVGNSSTSAGPTRSGSNARTGYAVPVFLARLHQQYRKNNLYIYPEHLDYDPGRDKRPGYGDLFHLNTPYIIISRGSSGSDRPFMKAAFRTLAAFRPDVKQKLAEAGLLMPAVQMILRRTYGGIDSDEQYMTGAAHPTAFAGGKVDEMAMVKLANAMTVDKLPPLSQLEVVEESASEALRDVLTGRHPERRGETPHAISRVYQGPRPAYRMVISAAASVDANDKPLKYHWKVLRGDADRITIEPRDDRGEVVELTVPFHNGPMESPDDPSIPHNRVDIACFADNGDYLSPPSFISFYMPPNQYRWVDEQGRTREIGYGVRESGPAVPLIRDLGGAYAAFGAEGAKGEALRKLVGDRELLAGLPRYAKVAAELQAAVDAAEAAAREAGNAAREARKAEAENAEALQQVSREKRDALDKARKAFAERMNEPLGEGEPTPRRWMERMVEAAIADPQKTADHAPELLKHAGGVIHRIRSFEKLGLVELANDREVALTPLREGAGPAGERLTPYERARMRELGLMFLAQMTGRAVSPPDVALVDRRVYAHRDWRDIYHYDAQGEMTGWTRRYPDGTVEQYRHDGMKLVEVDGKGPAKQAVPVRYQPGKRGLEVKELRPQAGQEPAQRGG